jgi:hypothetical protein
VRPTRGVLPTAPVKPSAPTAFVANPLVSMRFRAIENMGEGEDRPMSLHNYEFHNMVLTTSKWSTTSYDVLLK